MLTFLQAHYRERLTLDQVAQAANVSRNTCLACFRRVLGLSPMEYLLNHRLEQGLPPAADHPLAGEPGGGGLRLRRRQLFWQSLSEKDRPLPRQVPGPAAAEPTIPSKGGIPL